MNLSKKWKGIFGGVVFALATLTSVSASADLAEEMRSIGRNATVASKTDNSQEFVTALTALSGAAEKAKGYTPYSLKDNAKDSAEIKDYQHGLQELIDTAAEGVKQAQQGDLAKAKEQVAKLLEIRNEYHKKYK